MCRNSAELSPSTSVFPSTIIQNKNINICSSSQNLDSAPPRLAQVALPLPAEALVPCSLEAVLHLASTRLEALRIPLSSPVLASFAGHALVRAVLQLLHACSAPLHARELKCNMMARRHHERIISMLVEWTRNAPTFAAEVRALPFLVAQPSDAGVTGRTISSSHPANGNGEMIDHSLLALFARHSILTLGSIARSVAHSALNEAAVVPEPQAHTPPHAIGTAIQQSHWLHLFGPVLRAEAFETATALESASIQIMLQRLESVRLQMVVNLDTARL